jgi:hypothetical protein
MTDDITPFILNKKLPLFPNQQHGDEDSIDEPSCAFLCDEHVLGCAHGWFEKKKQKDLSASI